MAAVGVVVPPVGERLGGGGGVVESPVELREHVVDPAFAGPEGYVGIKSVVVFEAVGVAAAGVAFLVAPYSEGANAEAHPWLPCDDSLVDLLDEEVHIVAAPVASVHALAGAGIGGIVGEIDTRLGVGVEIVVHVDSVDVVAAHDVINYAHDEVAVLLQCRVEVHLSVILHESFRVLVVEMPLWQHFIGGGGYAVGVEPGV